ncbi:MAG: hypothetical protein H6739_08425 [Alphaproteobacteria bacterium]|nr:hypothetical protein [Alphaproteobacteria bacterium]
MISDSKLLSVIGGGLEPGADQELRAALRLSPSARRRLDALSARVDRLVEELDPPTWRPQWFSPRLAPPLAVRTAASAVMDARMGLTVEVTLPVEPALEAHRVVVLEAPQGEEDWTLAFPRDAEEALTLGALPRDAEGRAVIDLVRAEEPRVWAVMLVPPDVRVAWDEEGDARWRALRRAMAEGRVPVARVVTPGLKP